MPFRSVHRVLADPLRIRVLDALWTGPLSAKEIAGWADVRPDRLYHHLRRLEAAGLVEVAEYRSLPGGKVERVYRRVQVEPPGDDAGPGETAEFLGQMLLATRTGLDQAFAARERGANREVSLTRAGVRLHRARLDELRSRIGELIREAIDHPDEDGVWTEVLVAVVDQQDRAEPRASRSRKARKTTHGRRSRPKRGTGAG